MAIDSRLFTPASLMPRSSATPQGVMSVVQDGRPMSMPPAQPPTGLQSFAQSMNLPNQLFETTPEDDQQAKTIGAEIFDDFNIDELSTPALSSMATDNPEEVDDSAKTVYEKNKPLAQTLGSLIKIQESTKSSELFKKLLEEKTTPEQARAEVNKFFGKDPAGETPVWADVAVSIGLSLLRGEGKKEADDSPLTGFLKDVGVAGERGFATAKTRRKEKSARSNLLNKLAFGVFREDEKQRKTLSVQLAKQLGDERKTQQTLIMDLAKFYQNQEKINDAEARGRATAISSSLNILTKDQKEKALPIIARNPNAFKGVPADEVQSVMFGLLKSNGLKLDDIADATNIVETTFTIGSKPEFDFYKELFPNQFENLEFQDGKVYTVEGFSDKSKVGEANRGLVNILGIKKSIGAEPTDELQRLFQQRSLLRTSLQGLDQSSEDYKTFSEQLREVDGRIDIISERKLPTSYVFADGKMVAAGPGAAGAFAASDAVRVAKELDNQGASLASAFGLADGLMRSLASTPAPSDSVGVVAALGKFAGGVKGQLQAVTNAFGDDASDNANSYFNGAITSGMTGSKEKAVTKAGLGSSRYTVGQVFSRLEKITAGNTELRSQLMSFAYALAGSRETGKLTDKDVAAALVTFGGGDIAEGRWFANADVLVTGINQALTTATNDYAIKYNKTHSNPGNIKYLKEVENLTDDEIANRTTFDVNKFLKMNEGIRTGLSDRIIFGSGASGSDQLIRMQGLDKYRGDGAGNIEGTSGISNEAIFFNNLLTEAVKRTRLDPSDSNYLNAAGFDAIYDSVPQNIKDELRKIGEM